MANGGKDDIFMSALKIGVGEANFLTACVLLDEVRTKTGDGWHDNAWYVLLDTANTLGVQNPFAEKGLFDRIYEEFERARDLPWDAALDTFLESNSVPTPPEALAKMYEERTGEDAKTVLICEAEKFHLFLKGILERHPKARFTLSTGSAVTAKALSRIFRGCENIGIEISDLYSDGFTKEKFDAVFAVPGFGARTLAEGRELDIYAADRLLGNLEGGGRLLTLVSGRTTFSPDGGARELREKVETKFSLREISELPEGTLGFMGIKTYFVDILNAPSQSDTVLVGSYAAEEGRSRWMREKPKTLELKEKTEISLDALTKAGEWNVRRILAGGSAEYLEYMASDVRRVKLSEVADVFRGKAVTVKGEEGDTAVLGISNIGENGLILEKTDRIRAEGDRKIAGYLLKEGDLILTARGTVMKNAIFSDPGYPCIASANLLVVRPKDPAEGSPLPKLDSVCLKLFLDGAAGKKLLSSVQQGAVLMNVSPWDLAALEVPLPSEKEQTERAGRYREELAAYEEARTAAEKRWQAALEELRKF